MQAYHGGRAEARIRHEAVPCVLVDVMSEYPSANVLLGISDMLVAKELKIEDATQEVCLLLEKAEPDDIYDQVLWKQLAFFALVQPSEDVFPVRTLYNPRTTNIGINRLTSNSPVWFAGPDVLAAKIHSGKSPKILSAIRIVPVGRQEGLQPVSLRNMITIDPRTDDIYKAIIETRARVDSDQNIPEAEREALVYFLKILANSGSYGLFVELNPERVGNDPKTGKPA